MRRRARKVNGFRTSYAIDAGDLSAACKRDRYHLMALFSHPSHSRMRSVINCLTAALIALSCCAPGVHAQTQNAEPLATRQNFFTIPFSAPRVVQGRPVEVHLYVSADRGQSWKLYDRQTAGTGKFDFRAQRDGEYWFASRTVAQAMPSYQQAYRPELRVLIDTVSPELELSAGVGPAGEVEASWRIADPNLQVDSFKVYFRHGPTESWQAVAVEIPQGEHQNELSGTTTWWPRRHGTGLEVRAEVQDRAGNNNVVQRSIQLPNIAGNSQQLADTNSPPRNQPPVATPNFSDASPVEWPADEVIGQNGQPLRESERSFDAGNDSWPQPAPIGPEVADRIEAPFELPPGERPQMTQHARFNLDYDIDGVGPSGISTVELWATRDGGRIWRRLGIDEDRRSPYTVELEEEGIYGFRIVVQSGNGLASDTPTSGDPAEVWIGLDQTAPECEITSARYGRGQRVGTLSIFWEANDVALGPRPITLLFSDKPDGPWTTFAAGLPNNGRYDWRVDSRIPAQIYLRMEARDEAGNVAVHQIDRPIANDGLIPRGRIRGIVPVEQQPREAARNWPRW